METFHSCIILPLFRQKKWLLEHSFLNVYNALNSNKTGLFYVSYFFDISYFLLFRTKLAEDRLL